MLQPLAPARPVLRQEEIVREVGGVGHGERVGREELRRGDRARARHVAAHHAARQHSAARGREGAVQALAVQRARGRRPGDGQRGARDRSAGCEARRRRCAGGRQCARGHVADRDEVPGVGRVVDGESAAGDSGGRAQQAHAGRPRDAQRAARHGGGGRQRGSGHGAGGRQRSAGDRARGVHARREHVRAVYVVAQQLVAAHVALRGEPVQRGRAREGQRVGQQVRHGDRLSLEGANPDLQAVQVQRARRLLHQPGDRPAEGAEVQLRDSARRHREVQARRAPDSLRGRAEEGAGDAHVVVVGRADVHHQVGGRAQPAPAAEGVASPRRQGVAMFQTKVLRVMA